MFERNEKNLFKWELYYIIVQMGSHEYITTFSQLMKITWIYFESLFWVNSRLFIDKPKLLHLIIVAAAVATDKLCQRYFPRLLTSALFGMSVASFKLAPACPSQVTVGKGKKTVLGKVGGLAPICKVLIVNFCLCLFVCFHATNSKLWGSAFGILLWFSAQLFLLSNSFSYVTRVVDPNKAK